MNINMLHEATMLLDNISNAEINQQAQIKNKSMLERSIDDYTEKVKVASVDLDVLENALKLLREVSDDSVQDSYKFMEDTINSALTRIFPDKVRKVKLEEGNRGKNPTLDLILSTNNGITRSLSTGSGHGVVQVISIISILSLIAITGARRFAIFDEIMYGMSIETRKVMDSVLWAFADIGFQYLIVEHGYVPANSKVYELQSVNDVGSISKEYIEKYGIYLEGSRRKLNKNGEIETRDEPEVNEDGLGSIEE